jgi:hypothetical protein
MPNNVFTVRNTFCPYKNYNSILGDKLTVFKLSNCGIVLAMVSHVSFWIVSTYFITYEAYFVVGEFKGPREMTGGGGGEWEPNQILLQERTYVPSSNPKSKTL